MLPVGRDNIILAVFLLAAAIAVASFISYRFIKSSANYLYGSLRPPNGVDANFIARWTRLEARKFRHTVEEAQDGGTDMGVQLMGEFVYEAQVNGV
ncbi:hypothetical protein V502_05316 [Pseudogymnoascus sp. VKM F-4520 (FW-2644)]|nr:hypothetical protein V502_05316 [Pseudogymnoascus sp. VKM F-4520 (FW-2644)]